MRGIAALCILLGLLGSAYANNMFFFWVGQGGSATGTAPILTLSGPTSGFSGVPSSIFTVFLFNATFSGTQTVTIADGGAGGTVTPSVGTAGPTPLTVTPTAGMTSFTFTYTAPTNGTFTLVITNTAGAANPPSVPPYVATSACQQGSLKFNGNCTSVWLVTPGVIAP